MGRSERRGWETGNSGRFVKKESIIIQLLWRRTTRQRPLILAQAQAIYALAARSAFALSSTDTKKRCHVPHPETTCNTRRPGDTSREDQLDVLTDAHSLERENTHAQTRNTTQSQHTTFIPEETWAWAHTQLAARQKTQRTTGMWTGWKARRPWRRFLFGAFFAPGGLKLILRADLELGNITFKEAATLYDNSWCI